MGRIIIITGKGGVGKTSVAAAHALRSAQEGAKTLLVSADMAHNLGDIFEMRIGDQPREVSDRLWALELDPERLLQTEFPEVADAFAQMLPGSGLSGAEAEGPFPIPGLDDLFSLLKLKKLYEAGEYARIIVDCAPTGETLSLLKLPENLAWYMEKFFPVGKTMVRLLSPVSRLRYQVRLPDRKAMDGIGELHLRLLGLQELLRDGEVCTARLVATPEKMVVEETKRNYMYLNLYGYHTDGVFVNRVLSPQPGNAFLEGWRDIQQGWLRELRSVFSALPLTEIPWYPQEVRGLDALERLCAEALTAPDLFDVRVRGESEGYEAIPGGYRLVLPLPGARDGQVAVRCHSQDLDVETGNQLRRIPLPNLLRGISPGEVSLKDGVLRVSFLTEQGEEAATCGS